MSRQITVALAAIGGYGSGYVKTLLSPEYSRKVKIVGAVDPNPSSCPQLPELQALNIPVRSTMEALWAEFPASPDLCIVSSPIHMHAPQTIFALSRGSNVLCEKPMCATIQEADAIIEARNAAGKFVIIGYQRSFSAAVQELKQDIMTNVLGKPKRLRALCLGTRTDAYYSRNNWAGALKAPDGRWVLDSPANNANAHFLHHLFYVIGPRRNRSASCAKVTAELYRANRIQNFDTCAIRATTTHGVELLFISSHAVEVKGPTFFRHEFENAVASRESEDESVDIVARMTDGSTRAYGGIVRGEHIRGKLAEAVHLAAEGGGEVTCGPEAARSQTLCINAAYDSCPDIVEFPASMKAEQGDGGEHFVYVPGLADQLKQCYEEFKLPSEMGFKWAKAGKEIDVTNYRQFPGGRE